MRPVHDRLRPLTRWMPSPPKRCRSTAVPRSRRHHFRWSRPDRRTGPLPGAGRNRRRHHRRRHPLRQPRSSATAHGRHGHPAQASDCARGRGQRSSRWHHQRSTAPCSPPWAGTASAAGSRAPANPRHPRRWTAWSNPTETAAMTARQPASAAPAGQPANAGLPDPAQDGTGTQPPS